MKLLSMTDFVLEQYAKKIIGYDEFCIYVLNYANFLKQPLELWMFDENDERCLFEGFRYDNGYLIKSLTCINFKLHNTIEDIVKYNLQLTQTAIKELGL